MAHGWDLCSGGDEPVVGDLCSGVVEKFDGLDLCSGDDQEVLMAYNVWVDVKIVIRFWTMGLNCPLIFFDLR